MGKNRHGSYCITRALSVPSTAKHTSITKSIVDVPCRLTLGNLRLKGRGCIGCKLKVSKELRRMGSEAIHCRSEHRIEQTIEDFDKDHSTAIKSGKKLWWHTTFGEIAVYEQVFRVSGQRFRPFKIYQAQELLTDQANIEGCKLLIGEIDGSMIPASSR